MNNKLIQMLCVLLICGLSGCAGVKNSMRPSTKSSKWNPIKALSGDKETKLEETNPVAITAIWKESTYEKPGVASVNGFGGRFFFYDDDSNPVKADGELVVYGFDDSKDDASKSGPDKKFVFRKSDFQSHYSESGLGPSYSVWIPWEKVGGYRKMITLIPVFRRADGTIMKCSQSTVVLPGKPPAAQASQVTKDQPFKYLGSSSAIAGTSNYQKSFPKPFNNNGVQQAGFEGQEALPARIKTSTIVLPPSMAQRIAASRRPQNEVVKPPFNSEWASEIDDQHVSPISTGGTGFAGENSFPLKPGADQPESLASSPKSSPRKVFGAPGSFN